MRTCTRCELHKTAQYNCLFGRGPEPCDLMIIGEAPGKREDDIGKPFQGIAGQYLDQVLDENHLNRDKIYITNVVKCRPPDNRTPKPAEIQACSIYLQQEIALVKPKWVLLLGSTASQAVLGLKVTEARGKKYQKDGVIYFPTYHPAAILRDEAKAPIFEADIKSFLRTTRGKDLDLGNFKYKIVMSVDDLWECLVDLNKSVSLSFDIETTALSPWSGYINCIGLGGTKIQWVIPLCHSESPFKTKEIRQAVVDLLDAVVRDKRLIAQNGKFDSLWVWVHYGIRWPIYFDTMLASYLLDENDRHGLKYLASKHFGAEEYDVDKDTKIGRHSLENLGEYCAKDLFYTRSLYQLFREDLKEDPDVKRVFEQLLMPASDAYLTIEKNGVYIYEDRLSEVDTYLKEQMALFSGKLSEYKQGVNWNSPQQVACFLYDDARLPVIKKTKTGGRSTDESTLKQLASRHPVPELIIKWREANKYMSGFVKSWTAKLYNHRMHPTFKLHGTVTGRPSCEEPNLQQVPRDPLIRSLVGAPKGWVLVEADFSQVELRVAAMLAGEENMKAIFERGEDIHTATAEIVSGKNASDIPKEQLKEWRKKAKAVNFGFLYGMGAKKFREYARDKYGVDFTLEESEEIRERFFDTYSGLRPWHERQRRIAHAQGYVTNPTGRKRRLPMVYSDDFFQSSEAERQAINSPVQGFASDLTMMSVVQLHKELDQSVAKICGTVHDAILLRVKRTALPQVLPHIKRVMEHPALLDTFGINLPIPIEVEISVGDWSKGTVWHEGEAVRD